MDKFFTVGIQVSKIMRKHLHKRFPDQTAAIETLLKKDAVFNEICSDYEKACTWLAEYCRSVGLPSEKCDRFRELIRELEVEILEALGDAGI